MAKNRGAGTQRDDRTGEKQGQRQRRGTKPGKVSAPPTKLARSAGGGKAPGTKTEISSPSTLNGTAGPTSSSHGQRSLPLPFPRSKGLTVPQRGFLRDKEPHCEAFRAALDTAYEGIAFDRPGNDDGNVAAATDPSSESIRRALRVLDGAGYFRTDVTQPFGLGSKCSKTYVTRCLLGERGTTYKYLGLRMFAHPWDGTGCSIEDVGGKMSVRDAVQTIMGLNNRLKDRTRFHLARLDEKRRSRGAPLTRGRASFDVTLINKMRDSGDLKAEPTVGEGRCSVSWHADSCLEHYSTIAVYQTIFDDEVPADDGKTSTKRKKKKMFSIASGAIKRNNDGSGWSVALRVAHDSEGPTASHRGSAIDSSVITDTPSIAVSLPPESTYFLLDDFNHHHQHAVVASGNAATVGRREGETNLGVRFSSTHRLLREGHNVNFVIERCRAVCSSFHKKGPKIWRSEQLLLTDIESEWLRQFYIQGEGHKSNLWKAWKESICILMTYWSQLESRTKQIIDLLMWAAAEKMNGNVESGNSGELVPTRKERKMREKRKKAFLAVEDILERGNSANTSSCSAYAMVYEPFSKLLEERASMRELWRKRETDKVFQRMEGSYAPIPLPVVFDSCVRLPSKDNPEEESGLSPLSGSPESLRLLAQQIRSCGKAYDSRDSSALRIDAEKQQQQCLPEKRSTPVPTDEHKRKRRQKKRKSKNSGGGLPGKKKRRF